MIKLPVEIDNLINDLRILSWEAADILLFYSKMIKNSERIDEIVQSYISGPVTLADLKVNEIIINRINDKYKEIDWEILSEENVKSARNDFDSNADWLWILDPLDGTKDFIQGTSNYSMHLGLNYKQKPLIGIVLIPEKDELWISDGEEVWCEKRNKSRFNPNFSKNKDLKEMTLVTSKNHRNDILKNLIKKIDFKEVVIMGSIGCKIASIVRGDCDVYICLSLPKKSSPKDWDFAAPEAILKSSGGAITNLYNQELIYGKSNFEQSGVIVASNNANTHKNLCLEIKEVIKKYNICELPY